MERPAHPSLWRLAAPQGGQPCFGFAIELAVPSLPAWSIMQSGFDAFQHCTLTESLNGGTADLDGFGDLGVTPFLLLGTTIRFEEDASAGDGTGGGRACLDRALEEQALGIREGNDV